MRSRNVPSKRSGCGWTARHRRPAIAPVDTRCVSRGVRRDRAAADLRVPIAIQFLVTRDNAHEIDAMAALVKSLDLDG